MVIAGSNGSGTDLMTKGDVTSIYVRTCGMGNLI